MKGNYPSLNHPNLIVRVAILAFFVVTLLAVVWSFGIVSAFVPPEYFMVTYLAGMIGLSLLAWTILKWLNRRLENYGN